MAVVLVLALALAAGFAWLRDSSLVEVREVRVTGLSSDVPPEVRQALRETARDMATLHVREDALRAAVAAYPSVAGLRVDAQPPHTLVVEVLERRPVAVVAAGGARIPATGSGLLLRGVRPAAGLPAVPARAVPAGRRVVEPRALSALAVSAAAPAPLRARVLRIGSGARGMVLELRDGPDLVFGSRAAAAAKWQAAARVLADPDAAGATYLDVRVPERVAAGGLDPVELPDPESLPTPEP